VTLNYQDLLKKGEADFAVFVAQDTERDIHAEPIATVAPRCYMRMAHPLAEKRMTLKDFLRYNHVRLYLPGLGRENVSMVDDVLGQYGSHRKVVLETTQFAPAVGVLISTDSLLVANAGFEESGLFNELIIGRELPDELQRMIRNTNSGNRGKMSLMRHTRTARSSPHQWMRGLLMQHLTKSRNKLDDSDAGSG
jgi:DNA-binding transcriptional LysR family regulator